MIPNYLATFRRAIRELGASEKSEISEKSLTLNSHNSLISHLPDSKKGDLVAPHAVKGSVPSLTYAEALDQLESRRPDYVDPQRWRQAIRDANCFLAKWGEQAHALGWTADELFRLHEMPARPAPSYRRLSRYDCTGLLWLLQARPVIALTDAAATIRTPSGGTLRILKERKTALGSLGDNLGGACP